MSMLIFVRGNGFCSLRELPKFTLKAPVYWKVGGPICARKGHIGSDVLSREPGNVERCNLWVRG